MVQIAYSIAHGAGGIANPTPCLAIVRGKLKDSCQEKVQLWGQGRMVQIACRGVVPPSIAHGGIANPTPWLSSVES